jgi:tRNA:m4X modification enzyme
MEQAVEQFHIRSGGQHHLHQQASLISHLRRISAMSDDDNDNVKPSSTEQSLPNILKVGAGRGMMGLASASVAAVAGSDTPTHLIMVERDVTRGKADTVLRRSKQVNPNITPACRAYMDPGKLTWSRINCDLCHIDVASVLPNVSGKQDEIVVVAKHLCGAGTYLALKSVELLKDRVSAGVLATYLLSRTLYVGALRRARFFMCCLSKR